MLLPDAARRGEIKFRLAKSLPYNRRLVIIAGLLAAGFSVQAMPVVPAAWSLAVGAALLLTASLLSVVKGFSNIPAEVRGKPEWRGAEKAQFQKVIDLDRKSRDWDQSALDITCGVGAMAFLGTAVVVVFVALFLVSNGERWLATAWALDACVLLAPHWVTGVRRILKNDPLTVKAAMLLFLMDIWGKARQEDETMLPQMEVRTGPAGEIPQDVKLVLRFGRLPETFLGLQVQVSINRVEGADFPYLCCVLVARPEMGMLPKIRPVPPPGLIVEPKSQKADNVDIVVIRQDPDIKRGYHTPPAAAQGILAYALQLARLLKSPA